MLPCLCVGLVSVCYGFWLSPACQSLVYPLRSLRSPLLTETTGNHYLKSTNPSLFPSHKGAMCTFSILPANNRVCVCVCFRNASAVFSLTSWFISSFPNFFFPFLYFSVFSLVLPTDCSSGPDRAEEGSQVAARAWPSHGPPLLPVCLSLCLCCSLCLTLS